ncbi:hypothetical protein FQA39_LY15324 [Lamprigera yunnana]|nr:hypothetical protein FQA39_LY15324 [Lamprigera yunnana]
MSKSQSNGYSTDEENKSKRMEAAKALGSDTDDYSTDDAAKKKKRDKIEGKEIFILSKKIIKTPIKNKPYQIKLEQGDDQTSVNLVDNTDNFRLGGLKISVLDKSVMAIKYLSEAELVTAIEEILTEKDEKPTWFNSIDSDEYSDHVSKTSDVSVEVLSKEKDFSEEDKVRCNYQNRNAVLSNALSYFST